MAIFISFQFFSCRILQTWVGKGWELARRFWIRSWRTPRRSPEELSCSPFLRMANPWASCGARVATSSNWKRPKIIWNRYRSKVNENSLKNHWTYWKWIKHWLCFEGFPRLVSVNVQALGLQFGFPAVIAVNFGKGRFGAQSPVVQSKSTIKWY